MRLLLDSHALLWAVGEPGRLREEARAALVDGANWVAVSAATIWELAIKRSLGRLRTPDDFFEEIDRTGFASIDVTRTHAMAVGDLPLHHRDPFDRLLVAQARVEGLTIVTRDPQIARYGVPVLEA